MGFHTDFSAASSGNISNDKITNWDLYHLSGGAKFPVAGSEMTLGGVFAFGGGVLGDNEIGLDRDLDLSFVRSTFIVGFEFSFGG